MILSICRLDTVGIGKSISTPASFGGRGDMDMKPVAPIMRLAPTRAQLWISLPFFFMIQKCFREDLPLLDFWWHLKMGRVILDSAAIPRIDTFSLTAAGHVFIIQNWLAEITLYALYAVGGGLLLIFFSTAIFIAVIYVLWRVCLRLSRSTWASVFSSIVVAVCIPANIRPQIFSFLFFALFYWILSSDKPVSVRRTCWLPVLMMAWVNMHGAFMLGLGLIAIFLAVEVVHFRVKSVAGEKADRAMVVQLGVAFMLSLAATLANPEGYGVYRYIGTVVNDPSSRLFVSEWQPPNILELSGILLYFVPFFLTSTALILSEKRPRLIDWVLFTTFAVFGITAMRNCAWFQLIAAPILARYLSSVPWEQLTRLWRRDFFRKSWLTHAPDSAKLRRINLAVAGLLVVLVVIRSPWWRSHRLGESLLEAGTPVAAVEFIAREGLVGNIFHPQIYGDYVLWKLGPDRKVFFDGRVHLYGEEFVRNYLRIQQDSAWEELLKPYKIGFLLLDKKDGQDELNLLNRARRSANWRVIYEDAISVLLQKVNSNG